METTILFLELLFLPDLLHIPVGHDDANEYVQGRDDPTKRPTRRQTDQRWELRRSTKEINTNGEKRENRRLQLTAPLRAGGLLPVQDLFKFGQLARVLLGS